MGRERRLPFRQLPGLMDFPDPRQVVDDLILRPKVEQMDDNPGDYVEIDYDMKLREDGNFRFQIQLKMSNQCGSPQED